MNKRVLEALAASLLAATFAMAGCSRLSGQSALDQKNRAKQLVMQAKWAEASPLLQDAVAKDPKDPEGQFLLGLTFYNLNNYPAAVNHFQAAINLNPGMVIARIDLANVYRDMKDWAKAEAAYRDVIQRAPDQGQVYVNLAQMLRQNGRAKDALVVLEEGQTKAGSADVIAALGDFYAEQKQPDEAKAAYERALKVEPNNAQAKAGLGKLGK